MNTPYFSLFILSAVLSLFAFTLLWRSHNQRNKLRKSIEEITEIECGRGESSEQYVIRAVLDGHRRIGSSQMQMKQQFKESALYLHAMNQMSVPLVMFNELFQPLFANTSMLQWLNDAAEDILEKQPRFDVQEPLSTFSFSEYVELETIQPGEKETLYVGALVIQVSIDPVQLPDGSISYVLQWEDYTGQRAMERKLEDVVGDILYGDLGSTLDIDEFSGFMQFMGTSINQVVETVREPIQELLRVLPLIEQGDLTQQMEGSYAGKYKNLKLSLNGMVHNLNKILHKARAATRDIDRHSVMIAGRNSALKSHIADQSESSERIAEAVSRMVSEFKKGRENIRNTRLLADQLREDAVAGESTMQEAVHSMRGISDSSQKISDIVGVIDSIAFQTNLLALNAAVEAARAGEQGRGFAVVAGEVRSLAQRSADSAREIKKLVESSVSEVEGGRQCVEATGTVFSKISSDVAEMTTSVQAISDAGGKQLEEVEQVNRDLEQLSGSNQQNRNMVQEVRVASQAIQGAVAELVTEMGAFSLSVQADDEGAVEESDKGSGSDHSKGSFDGLDIEMF